MGGVQLSEKDLHCIARVLQGCRYTDGAMFGCCKFCLYQEKCNEDAKKGKVYFTDVAAEKLQEATGVYLGMSVHNLEEKLLRNSFQLTNKPENKQ